MSSRSVSRQLLNSRARIQHLGGHAWVSGWLYDLSLPSAWISSDTPLALGERIELMVQSDLMSVHLTARVECVDKAESRNRRSPVYVDRGVAIPHPQQHYYLVEITSPIRPSPNQQTDRKAVAAFGAKLDCYEGPLQVLVADMSQGGARVLSTESFDTEGEFELICEVGGKIVRLPSIPRYVRRESGKDDLFSVGLRFAQVSRIDAARWKTRLNEAYVVPARAPEGTAMQDIKPAILDEGYDLRLIANKLIAKIREVNRAERDYLRQHLAARKGGLTFEDFTALEAKLDVIANHKDQFSKSLAATIDVMQARIDALDAA